MAFILRRNGEPVAGTITLVEGNTLKLKIERVDKRVALSFLSTSPNVMSVEEVSHNTQSDTWLFSLVARIAGHASLTVAVTAPSDVRFSPPPALQLTVDEKISLPDENSVAGLLVRLFLLEVGPPEGRFDDVVAAEDRTAMRYIRLVLENRLKNPGPFMAKGAANLFDIVRAPNQVDGFTNYPILAGNHATRLAQIVATINDGTLAARSAVVSFYQTALAITNEPVISDPCTSGLYAWRTARAASPGPNFVAYKTIAGNVFYTLKPAAK